MKILHLSSAMTWRGGEQQLTYLYTELNKRNDLQQIIACPKNSELSKRGTNQNFNIFTYHKSAVLNLSFALRLKTYCRLQKVDVIHAHDSHAHTAAYIAGILGNNVPLVISRRVDFVVGKGLLSHKKYNHKNIKRIICVSKAIEKIMAAVITRKGVLCTIYSGTDSARFPYKKKTGDLYKLTGLAENTPLIGNTSALAAHKDYYTFIDTAALINKSLPNAHFVIIGDGKMKEELLAYTAKKGLESHFHFLGFRADIELLLPDFDIFLMTSKTEGLGTSILDAFACRVPVVATTAGGIPEIVKHKHTGLLAPIGDAASLAQNSLLLLKQPDLKTELSNNAENALKIFSKENMAQKTYEVYEEII